MRILLHSHYAWYLHLLGDKMLTKSAKLEDMHKKYMCITQACQSIHFYMDFSYELQMKNK
jgi:hypothetical protein